MAGCRTGPAHGIAANGKSWNWIAAQPFFLRGIDLNGSPESLTILLELFSVGLAAIIPLGGGGERWKLGAICASTALFAGWTYPLFAHWVWGGGWLAQIGFVDAGGSSAIHATGGLTALAMSWILGPRRGKYGMDGMPSAMPGHSAVIVLFACVLTLLGWIGLNLAARIYSLARNRELLCLSRSTRCSRLQPRRSQPRRLPGFDLAAGRLAVREWLGRWSGGESAACASMKPAVAVLIGAIAGALITFTVEWFDLYLSVDDPGGAISVHGIAGIWGVLAAGLFGRWLPQLTGIAALLGFVLPMTYGLNLLLNRLYPQRVAPEGERQGMDLFELGAGAYPEFYTHNEEFTQR